MQCAFARFYRQTCAAALHFTTEVIAGCVHDMVYRTVSIATPGLDNGVLLEV